MERSGDEVKQSRNLRITIKTFFGFEEVLKEELAELGFSEVRLMNRSVQLEGSWRDVYYLNIHLRTALSVLVEIKFFRIRNEEDLYKEAMKVDWSRYFDVDKSFAVRGAVFSEIFRHSQYPMLLLKDAIADSFRNRIQKRPDVNTKTPQVVFDLYINKNEVTISLNTSGAPLFQRGYRDSTGEAPLNEVVAAGLIRLSGWDRKSMLYDPFCGSGTLLIEAAMMAAGIAPSVMRQHFAFKNFRNFDQQCFDELRENIDFRITEMPCTIAGSDISAEMVTKTRRNLRGFSFGRFVATSVMDFRELKRMEESGTIICNPPYGERIGEEVDTLYADFGEWLKHEMTGWNCFILSSNIDAFKSISLKPSSKIKVFNGNLECSFRKYVMR